MKEMLVVYDSVRGNTETIAKAVAQALSPSGGARTLRPGAVSAADLDSLDLLVVGSPTLGGRATPATQQFLDRIPPGSLTGIRVAAFDTRLRTRLVRIFGYAAEQIGASLVERGGEAVAAPEGFTVRGRSGPLTEGEVERASAWAKAMAGSES